MQVLNTHMIQYLPKYQHLVRDEKVAGCVDALANIDSVCLRNDIEVSWLALWLLDLANNLLS